jgi:hypothetical protein
MSPRSNALPGQRRGLFARVALALTSTIALIGAAVLGAFVFIALLGLLVLAAAALWARVAWLRWRLQRSGAMPGQAPGTARVAPGAARRNAVLEGEFEVITPERQRAGR